MSKACRRARRDSRWSALPTRPAMTTAAFAVNVRTSPGPGIHQCGVGIVVGTDSNIWRCAWELTVLIGDTGNHK